MPFSYNTHTPDYCVAHEERISSGSFSLSQNATEIAMHVLKTSVMRVRIGGIDGQTFRCPVAKHE